MGEFRLPNTIAVGGSAPDEWGDWAYTSGVSGTVVVPAGGRVVGIAAYAGAGAGSITINAGPSVPIPASSAVAVAPRGRLVAPTVIFDSTIAYFLEWVT